MPSLYTFMLAEAEELVLRERDLDFYRMTKDHYLGCLMMFERLSVGLAEAGFLDLRQEQHLRAVVFPVLDRYYKQGGSYEPT